MLASQVFAASLLAFRYATARLYYPQAIPATFVISGVIITEITGVSVLLAILCAQEAIRRGVRPLLAYCVNLLLASVCSGVLQWYVRYWLGLQVVVDSLGLSLTVRRMNMLYIALDTVICGAFVMIVYAHWQRELRSQRLMKALQLEHLKLEQQLMHSRLLAAQTEVEPQVLLATLGRIKDLYEAASPAAELALDEFIQGLRARLTATGGAVEPVRSATGV